ncbi:hypothetical protein NDU88_002285 [Pleurodeles waltl]|uniref:Uncharacterized protein n=1 Tax=Pleurodeles waltl TaxID=8319 RepID=A0AAV7S9W3_PLEWA|nr:hypothetical protein NDU88_002285 [Pleurodeles waltl]
MRVAHARSGARLQARFHLEKRVERMERPFEERTLGGPFKMAAPRADHNFDSAQVNSSSGHLRVGGARERQGNRSSEQIEFVDSRGAVFKGTVCGEANRDVSVGRAFVSLDCWQQGSDGRPAACDTSHAYSGHGAQVRHRRSGRIVGGQSLSVKVRAPSKHREEGRVRSGAVHPTSGECIGAADVQPSTSQGAGAGWTCGDEELLDYDDEVEDPVMFHKRVVVAEEEPDVTRGGHVAAPPHELTAGNLPRGEVGNQRRGNLEDLVRTRVPKVGVGLREAKNKVDASIQVTEVTVEGKSEPEADLSHGKEYQDEKSGVSDHSEQPHILAVEVASGTNELLGLSPY